ncbi:tripartite tricarboxylate transporter permease [Methanobacterium alcaliphilum]|uniref:tripartite tricarboxylate transporter permease n=1 Tax=Methanobacterium alcaliphilum TaxID=392018 RepID=UPI00200B551D|nr:tripartite tricarboxylate transporter permease [Methanobacterium alcaliphilum]
MFDLILACIIGVLFGVITGLIPGIHVNTVGAIVFASATSLLNLFSLEFLCVFLVAMSISHALLEFIPSMFLGVPEEATALSILPGHRMVLEGRSREAIRLVAVGGFGAIMITILLLPLFVIFLPPLYGFLKPYIWIILIIMSIYMLIRLSADLNTFLWSLFLFLFSGIMGWVMLNTPISSGLSLMCLFTGMFGVSTMLFSLNEKSCLPHQHKFNKICLNINIFRGMVAGGIAGTILGFLPGFGPAQGSIIAQELSGGSEENNESFLTSMSGVNTSDTLFSLIAIYLIGNPRSGIAVYLSQLIQEFNINYLLFFIFASLTAVSVSLILCIKLGDYLSEYMQKLNYKKISWGVIIFMSGLLLIFSILENVSLPFISLVYATAIAIGLLPHYLGVSKSQLMGVLILPAVVIYFNMGF